MANDSLKSENEQLYGNTTTSSFDKLEQLGPSLLEVLTFVNPPLPRTHQEQHDALLQQQAGDDPTQESGDSHHRASQQQFLSDQSNNNSDASLATTTTSVKFEPSVSRSAVMGKVADASVDNARKTQEYFAKILAKLEIEATGLVLLQDATILLYLETTAEQFLVLCRQLLLQKVIEPASMRVLASCDDLPVRLLHGLYFKKVSVTRQGGGESEWTDESFQQLAVETFLNLVKFVKKIGLLSPAEIRKCLTNLTISDQMLLPANDLVLALLQRDEFMSLDEFLHVYDSPIELELESERVWPVHPLIHY